MEFSYDIQDLSRLTNVSKATIYANIKKNQEFFKENSRREKSENTKTKPKVKFNQVALDFLLSQYGKKESAESIFSPRLEGPSNLSENALKNDSEKEADQILIKTLQAKIEALEAKIEALEKELASKEGERKELLNQNGALILTIQQQQQERMILLPAPKKSIGERIKGLFSKS